MAALVPPEIGNEVACIPDSEMTMRTGPLLSVRASQAQRAAGVIALCLLLAACFGAPQRPIAGPDPSDPNVRAPAVTYRPVLGGYVSQRPVEPAPWREQNDRVAPAPKQ